MQWQNVSHADNVGTHTIVRLPGVTDEVFMQKMCDEILPAAPVPPLNRATNVVAQELYKDESDGVTTTYQWKIIWNGINRPDLVQRGCEEMYDAIRAQLEQVGVRTAFSVGCGKARWESS